MPAPSGLGELPSQAPQRSTAALASDALVEGGRGVMDGFAVRRYLADVDEGVSGARSGNRASTRKAVDTVQRMPTEREDHAALGGPFNLITTADGRRLACTEVQDDGKMYSEHSKVHELEARYGILRSQALTPSESLAFVEKLLGER